MILDRINNPDELKKLTVSELNTLSDEIRQLIISTVKKNGGHLASALGAIELTIAVHYTFNAPEDKIIFDVGHQSYAHKILTGRRETFNTLRKFKGEKGFTRSTDSEYDTFISGHASTSFSVACGLMRARALLNEDYEIISIIGDGALTGGMTHEALNDAGSIRGKQIIILNDNTMSIEKSVGSIADYLARMHTKRWYVKLKYCTKKRLSKPKKNKQTTLKILRNIRNSIKYLLQGGLPFDQYGIKYFGPVDGHDIEQLIRYLDIAKRETKSVIIHAVTVKGKGYPQAVIQPDHYHGLSAPDEVCPDKTFSKQAGKSLIEIAALNDKVCAVTAAMSCGTGLSIFKDKYPERFYDVGIAEAHAVTMCAAMASKGYKPYFAVYSTFLQRGFDQIIHDVAIEKQNVTFLIDRAGIVGSDGETHQGTLDISYLSLIPGMTIAAPMDLEELDMMIKWSLNFAGPLAIRYPKGGINLDVIHQQVETGKWSIILDSESDCVVIASGADMVNNAYKAAKAEKVTLINARFLKPLDSEMLLKIKDKKIITVEDNVINGGLFSLISSFYVSNGISPAITPLSINDNFVPQGTKQQLFKHNKLDAESIAAAIKKCV
ncbi:MAG: 1-deoxy-D-xylulose-5-phosphate synthase [Christensenellales bacterium]|jgi:1-deoxy-D-xylulose-5-phosphate synthase